MATTTTMFTFTDFLLKKIRALSALQAPVMVYDGEPGPNRPELYVQIGHESARALESKQDWAQLGAGAIWEDYTVACMIWSWVGGDDNAGQYQLGIEDAQKTARDNALTLFNAIENALRSDINFLAANGGGVPLVLWSRIDAIHVLQTPNPAAGDDGSMGRSCQIDFGILVKARI